MNTEKWIFSIFQTSLIDPKAIAHQSRADIFKKYPKLSGQEHNKSHYESAFAIHLDTNFPHQMLLGFQKALEQKSD